MLLHQLSNVLVTVMERVRSVLLAQFQVAGSVDAFIQAKDTGAVSAMTAVVGHLSTLGAVLLFGLALRNRGLKQPAEEVNEWLVQQCGHCSELAWARFKEKSSKVSYMHFSVVAVA